MQIEPYILAGGRSSRMGRDKATVLLGGRTLLAWAVGLVRQLTVLSQAAGPPTVTMIRGSSEAGAGTSDALEGTDRIITDHHPGCGPLGGIEAALCDLEDSGRAEWALFLPIDMPFIPAGLLDGIVRQWVDAATLGASVCFLVVDGLPQPLVSLIHVSLRPFITEALAAQRFKVAPVLQSGCDALALLRKGEITPGRSLHFQTCVSKDHLVAMNACWTPSAIEQEVRHLWFANLNSPDDMREAETFFAEKGFSER